jgi:hypothetical protein
MSSWSAGCLSRDFSATRKTSTIPRSRRLSRATHTAASHATLPDARETANGTEGADSCDSRNY